MHLCVKTLHLYPIDTQQARSFECLIRVYLKETVIDAQGFTGEQTEGGLAFRLSQSHRYQVT